MGLPSAMAASGEKTEALVGGEQPETKTRSLQIYLDCLM
jgi:hypothetical protein